MLGNMRTIADSAAGDNREIGSIRAEGELVGPT
jgi:hypothetical protein